MSDATPPPMPGFSPPAPPKRSRSNAIIIGSAVAVIVAIVGTGVVVVQSRDNGKPKAAESSTPADDTVTAAEEPEPTPEDTEPEIMALTDGVSYEDGVELSLSKFTRGTSSAYGSPENAPYVSFMLKIKNGSTSTLDLASSYFLCSYGDSAKEGEEIFDSDRGLEGVPPTHLRPGRSASAKVACQMPRGEEYLQVEVSPSMESEVAIFAGNVK